MSGGSDLFYLFIFAIWLRRDVERKREKSRCAQLLAAALAAQDLVPSPAPGPADRDLSPRPLPPLEPPETGRWHPWAPATSPAGMRCGYLHADGLSLDVQPWTSSIRDVGHTMAQ